MDETTFINAIDCRFPYADEIQWRALIQQGRAISANAMFAVLHKIARKPLHAPVTATEQLAMVTAWAADNPHPLTALAVAAAQAIILNRPLPLPRVLAGFDQVQAHHNQYSLLSLLHFATDDESWTVEQKFEAVVATWQAADQALAPNERQPDAI